MSLAVTGIGVVSPAGIGREAFFRAVTDDARAKYRFNAPDFSLEEYLENTKVFRRASNATKYVLAAISLALADAGRGTAIEGPEKMGLVVCLTHGSIVYSSMFNKNLLLEGPSGASPLFFTESVLNASAGTSAIAFGIKGPVHTLIGDQPVAMQAIGLAEMLLRFGGLERCIVAGTEEWSDIVEDAYRLSDRAGRLRGTVSDAPAPLGEGAAALVLENGDAHGHGGQKPRALIGAVSVRRCSEDSRSDEVDEGIRRALRLSALSREQIGHIILPVGRHRKYVEQGAAAALGPRWKAVPHIDVAKCVGDTFGVSGLLQVAVSAEWISSGRSEGVGLVLSGGDGGCFSLALMA